MSHIPVSWKSSQNEWYIRAAWPHLLLVQCLMLSSTQTLWDLNLSKTQQENPELTHLSNLCVKMEIFLQTNLSPNMFDSFHPKRDLLLASKGWIYLILTDEQHFILWQTLETRSRYFFTFSIQAEDECFFVCFDQWSWITLRKNLAL